MNKDLQRRFIKGIQDVVSKRIKSDKERFDFVVLTVKEFKNEIYGPFFHEYLDSAFTFRGNVSNSIFSSTYDTDMCVFARTTSGNVIALTNGGSIKHEECEEIRVAISGSDWIDLHFYSNKNKNDYVSLVLVPKDERDEM